jgi:deoxyadenosine/deoxycytidine kinase
MWVATEGCIGIGKTTLAKFLAERYGGTPLIEETKKHPFIAEFYLNPTAYAFETEMGFALIHYHQLHRAQGEGLFNRLVFSDFAFDKDRLFAELTLQDEEEQRLFGFTYDFFKSKTPAPNLLICLKAPTDFLFERVRQRGREFEAKIPYDYLDRVNGKYNEFFDSYDQSEKIFLNASDLHVAEGGSALHRTLVERVVPLIDHIISDSEDA